MSGPEVQHVYPVDDLAHDTDGGFCWCQPETEDVPPNGRIVIHRRSLDSPHREAASPAHPDDGHAHSWGCRRCGVDRAAAPLDVETVTAAWTAAGALTNGWTDFLMELTNELNARLTEDARRG